MRRVNSGIYAGPENNSGVVGTIGKRIVALRLARGLSQPELARRVGIKQPSLHNIESGKTKKLRGDTLAGLCAVLGVPPDVILHGTKVGDRESMLHEAELLSIWRRLTNEDRDHLLAITRALGQRMQPARKGDSDHKAGSGTCSTDQGHLSER